MDSGIPVSQGKCPRWTNHVSELRFTITILVIPAFSCLENENVCDVNARCTIHGYKGVVICARTLMTV